MTKKLRQNEDFNRLFRIAAVCSLVSSYSLVPGQRVKCVVAGLSDDHTAPVVRFNDFGKRPGLRDTLKCGALTMTPQEPQMQLKDDKFHRTCRRAHTNIFVFIELLH